MARTNSADAGDATSDERTDANDGDEVHRIVVDRGLYSDSKAKLAVAGYPTFMLGYELTRKLQRRMADLDRSVLDDGDHVGNVHVTANAARVEWLDG